MAINFLRITQNLQCDCGRKNLLETLLNTPDDRVFDVISQVVSEVPRSPSSDDQSPPDFQRRNHL
jgi:hypothetical protein